MTPEDVFAARLRDCGAKQSVNHGKDVHTEIDRAGYGGGRYLGNLLVQMYGRFGHLEDARSVFDNIRDPNSYSWNIMQAAYSRNGLVCEARDIFERNPWRNVVSWNGMLAAYAQNGYSSEALRLLKRMWLEGQPGNEVTFICAIDACSRVQDVDEGIRVHGLVHAAGCADSKVTNALITMYGRCGRLEDARKLLDSIPDEGRDLVSWTSMITAYAQDGQGSQALNLFHRLSLEGIKADEITFVSALDACDDQLTVKAVRAVLGSTGFENDSDVQSALISAYSKCGCIEEARSIFDAMRGACKIESWNSIISAYAASGNRKQEALKLLASMALEGVKVDEITAISSVEACTSLEQVLMVLHELEQELCSRKLLNAAINKCGECGSLAAAESIFTGLCALGLPDVISWNSLLGACVDNEENEKAIALLRTMDLEGMVANVITSVTALQAAANLVALDVGRILHEHAITLGADSNVKLVTALVNMYSRCGCLNEALLLFNKMPAPTVHLWSSITSALAAGGRNKDAIGFFRLMLSEGFKADRVALATALYAHSHAGLLQDATSFLSTMEQDFHIAPSSELLVCMVDILGRAGRLSEAQELSQSMPQNPSAWMALLGSCSIHGDTQRAEVAASHASSATMGSVYVQLASLYRIIKG